VTQEVLQREIMSALAKVQDPATGQDVVAAGRVRDVGVDEGNVKITVSLGPQGQGSVVRAVRSAAEAVTGVTRVRVNVELPKAPSSEKPKGGGLKPGSVPAPTPKPGLLPDVGRIIAVSSGKGGVGKSMVAANLAAAFASDGRRVGLLDADIYGPNIPTMFGVTGRPAVSGEKGQEMIEPIDAHGVRLMSLGFLLEADQPAIMRGPLIAGILKQFLGQVQWGPLDVMVVDMPPGTGDAQLSLVQTIDLDGAVMVTTPQLVSTGDVRRGIKMFERVNTKVLGIVENMSGFICPSCNEEHDLFGRGGGKSLAEELNVPFLGAVPLDPRVRVSGDEGHPAVLSVPDSPAAIAIRAVAENVLATLA
jgi:ATP-binding protein involved in chromosome partitioning